MQRFVTNFVAVYSIGSEGDSNSMRCWTSNVPLAHCNDLKATLPRSATS